MRRDIRSIVVGGAALALVAGVTTALQSPAQAAVATSGSSLSAINTSGGQWTPNTVHPHNGNYAKTDDLSDADSHAYATHKLTASAKGLTSTGTLTMTSQRTDEPAAGEIRATTSLTPTETAKYRVHATAIANGLTSPYCVPSAFSVKIGATNVVDRTITCAAPSFTVDTTVTVPAGTKATLYADGFVSARAQSAGVSVTRSLTWSMSLTRIGSPASPIRNTALPHVSGTKRVGKRLSATEGRWSGSPTQFRYQWFRGQVPIPGATKSTYKLKKADKGKRVKVRVTASRGSAKTEVFSAGYKIKKKKR